MEITVKMLNGKSCVLMVDPQDTVGTLKRRIQEKLGVIPREQKLVFENGHKTELSDDSQSVCYYGLQSGSLEVWLLVTPPAPFQVFLKNEKGVTSTYDVKPDETVSNFKARVQKREGVPASQQRLNYQGREMSDHNKLSDYGVEALGTIYMTLRLRGG